MVCGYLTTKVLLLLLYLDFHYVLGEIDSITVYFLLFLLKKNVFFSLSFSFSFGRWLWGFSSFFSFCGPSFLFGSPTPLPPPLPVPVPLPLPLPSIKLCFMSTLSTCVWVRLFFFFVSLAWWLGGFSFFILVWPPARYLGNRSSVVSASLVFLFLMSA